MFINKRLIVLSKSFNFWFNSVNSFFYIKGIYGLLVLRMPSFYFVYSKSNFLSFLFLNKFFFRSIFKHFSYLYKNVFFFNYVKLKIKGLGYRIRKISKSLFCFFFGNTSLFYFYAPTNVIVKARKRKLLLMSNNLSILKMVLAHLLLLKKLSVYRTRGLVYPRQIFILKVGKKNL